MSQGKPERHTAYLLAALTIGAACLFILFLAGLLHAEAIFDHGSHDLGELEEGRSYTFDIELTNISGIEVRITDVSVSCGCTEATAHSDAVPAGGTVPLTVTIDTSGKKGSVVKVIEVGTDRFDEPHELVLRARVTHPEGVPPDASVIFRGSCATCHVGENIKQRHGSELYNAVCYMCHKGADGFRAVTGSQLADSISNGVPGTSMPGFLHSQGGPLSSEQVDSLARLIRSRNTNQSSSQ
jgi:cytochrome c2